MARRVSNRASSASSADAQQFSGLRRESCSFSPRAYEELKSKIKNDPRIKRFSEDQKKKIEGLINSQREQIQNSGRKSRERVDLYHPIEHQVVEEDDAQNLRAANMIVEQSAEDHTESGIEPSLGRTRVSNSGSPVQPINSMLPPEEVFA